MQVRRYPHRHHHKPLYEVSLPHHLVSIVIAVGIAIGVTALLIHFIRPNNVFDINRISLREVVLGMFNTLYRMAAAFILALVLSIPVALFIASTPRIQRILLPIADILQSVPVLAFFPVVAAFFIARNAFELAAGGWKR